MQSYRIDYQETFAPVVKLNTIRVLLSLVVNWDWPFHQLDIKNAFLNGDLEEEVHIEIPLGFETKTNINKFYKLKKIPIWSQEISLSLVWLFYQCCKEVLLLPMSIWPHSVCKTHSQVIAIIIIYVNDITLTGDHEEEIGKFKTFLAYEFEIKDLGNLKYFLGMEIAR